MKLGLALDSWKASSRLELPVALVQPAERLGYHSVWTAEAYGVDALTPLGYLAAVTSRIRLGTSVVQIGARTPTATAMAFATLDELAGRSRVIAGVGVSGPEASVRRAEQPADLADLSGGPAPPFSSPGARGARPGGSPPEPAGPRAG
jgi:alkanesulfonate monooxygenase SsuD/methylene tetrahydromethanopterin reductase-like flavin-dependent oxidoreductase (luciferase family)